MQRVIIFLALFAIAVVSKQLDQDNVCQNPKGGGVISDKAANGRVHCFSGDQCFGWRHATCKKSDSAKYCECAEDQCIHAGECIDKGKCPLNTQGSCKVFDCKSWRKSTCSAQGFVSGNNCVCPPGKCAVKGECVDQGDCPKYQQETCAFFGCKDGATCVSQYCMCPDDQCSVNSKCVPKTAAAIELSRQEEQTMHISSEMGLAIIAASAVVIGYALFARRARKLQEPSVTYHRFEQ